MHNFNGAMCILWWIYARWSASNLDDSIKEIALFGYFNNDLDWTKIGLGARAWIVHVWYPSSPTQPTTPQEQICHFDLFSEVVGFQNGVVVRRRPSSSVVAVRHRPSSPVVVVRRRPSSVVVRPSSFVVVRFPFFSIFRGSGVCEIIARAHDFHKIVRTPRTPQIQCWRILLARRPLQKRAFISHGQIDQKTPQH